MAALEHGTRIVTLDIVRGVAVMGILAMNIVGFAMPQAAYANPLAYGTESFADLASWAFSFVFIDGRMRGLFSCLFGAGMLLVIERAAASGRSEVQVHFRRMAWLFAFGLLHLHLVWAGDILTHYALVGMVAFAFSGERPAVLMRWAAGLLAVQCAIFAGLAVAVAMAQADALAPGASDQAVRDWQAMARGMGAYAEGDLQQELALHHGPFLELVGHSLRSYAFDPIQSVMLVGCETLAYMLLGMAAYRTGFVTGQWQVSTYRRIVLVGFGLGAPLYALLAYLLIEGDFDVPLIFAAGFAATVPLRPPMIAALAALVILLTRRGGLLVERIAATGRTAFTNYLATSLLMTFLFYGWGLGWFGTLSRIELWPVVFGAWALMLLWPKPWLDRYRHGPFEWLWRSLARGKFEPMRRSAPAATSA